MKKNTPNIKNYIKEIAKIVTLLLGVLIIVLILLSNRDNIIRFIHPDTSVNTQTDSTCHEDVVTAQSIIDAINQERHNYGLPSLDTNPALTAVSVLKIGDMESEHFYAHSDPQGHPFEYWFQEVGYPYTYAGENLAEDYSTTDEFVTAWMNSPEHKANILNPHYTETGVSVSCGLTDKETTIVVAEYGSR